MSKCIRFCIVCASLYKCCRNKLQDSSSRRGVKHNVEILTNEKLKLRNKSEDKFGRFGYVSDLLSFMIACKMKYLLGNVLSLMSVSTTC